jgi:hypothetical protein
MCLLDIFHNYYNNHVVANVGYKIYSEMRNSEYASQLIAYVKT